MNVIADTTEASDVTNIRWREETDPAAWDGALVKLGGHPLQSALWGDARREADGIENRRLVVEGRSGPLLMARIEVRRIPLIGAEVGWIPRGPAGNANNAADEIAFRALIGTTGYRPVLIVTDRWQETSVAVTPAATRRPETIWIDLSSGREAAWQRLDRQWRYGVGKAQRTGVAVGQSRSDADIRNFIQLIDRIGAEKKFESAVSEGALRRLLAGDPKGPVTAHMFVANYEGAFAAAALIFKCGRSAHYLSGGTDRRYSRHRVGEVLHWSIIEWAIGQEMSLYDLEGIDRKRNPGTFAFKKKMGGREVVLVGKNYYALSTLGKAVAAFDRNRDRFAFPSWPAGRRENSDRS
jgi:CelD/BcsL family acetyltransferase involved in cellulose biosynthesis